jgi:hypothetical protein
MQKTKLDGNLEGHETDMPVTRFLNARWRPERAKVAGLLDYGYVERQIADMLSLSVKHVQWLMMKHGYKTVDQMQLTNPERAGGDDE